LELTTVTSTHAITTLVPLLTAIGSIKILKEDIKKKQYIGFLIGLIGLSVLTLNPYLSNGTKVGTFKGNFLVLLSTFCTTCYLIYCKRVTRVITPFTALFGTLLFNTIFFTITSLLIGAFGTTLLKGPLVLENLYQLGYLVIFGTIIGFLTYQYGIKHASSFFSGISVYIQFPVVILIGVFFYGEILTFPFLLGVVLSIVGAFLAIDYSK